MPMSVETFINEPTSVETFSMTLLHGGDIRAAHAAYTEERAWEVEHGAGAVAASGRPGWGSGRVENKAVRDKSSLTQSLLRS
jgi:hypothetical protein